MTHLVTGGSGFLGNLLARRLAARGEKVRVLDVWEDPSRPEGIEFVKGDIRDRKGVEAAMKGVEVVYHNAALVPLAKAGKAFRDVNVEGSRLVAEAAARAGVRTFVYMSSSAIFGVPTECPLRQNSEAMPGEAYGRSKLEGENAAREACASRKICFFAVRPRTVLGPGRLGIFQILFSWIRESRSVYVLGSGNNVFQFVHALDLVEAVLLMVERGKPGNYNVGTDRYGTLREALERLILRAGSRSRVRSLPERPAVVLLAALNALRLCPLGPYHLLAYSKSIAFDLAPLHALGWKPRYGNDEMLWESYESFLLGNHRPGGTSASSPHRSPVKQGILKLLKRLS